MELITVLVGGHDVQEEDVLGLGVQAGQLKLHLREHLPKTENMKIYLEKKDLQMLSKILNGTLSLKIVLNISRVNPICHGRQFYHPAPSDLRRDMTPRG